MVQAVDYMRNEDGSPQVKNGDFVKGDATIQHQRSILLAAKNEYKSAPILGVVLREFINEDLDPDDLQQVIQKEFESDGMTIDKLKLNSFTDMDIKAGYE
jgi:hypothetical protein